MKITRLVEQFIRAPLDLAFSLYPSQQLAMETQLSINQSIYGQKLVNGFVERFELPTQSTAE